MRATNQGQQQGQPQQQGQMPMGGRMGKRQEEQSYAHIGETQPLMNHDHDLIHELSERIDAVWRYDQYIANAESKPEIQEFWRNVKQQDMEVVNRLKELIAGEVRDGCF